MIGAIAGDMAGSVYEARNIKTKDFELLARECFFTDDTVLTVALADSLLTGTPYRDNLRRFYRLYPDAGYGGSFQAWAARDDPAPYGSWGNGAAMRVSPVGFFYDDLDTVLDRAQAVTAVTHDHPEGIKGGQATAAAVLLARQGASKEAIAEYVTGSFGYDLSRPVEEIRPHYRFDLSCQGTVPVAIRAFLDAGDLEDALRTAISLGGDSDTIACITGAIAQAWHGGVPARVEAWVYDRLDARLAGITRAFMARIGAS
jgi:ADP-ribosylglycohydrolase